MYSTNRLCRYVFDTSITRVHSVFFSRRCTPPFGTKFQDLLRPQKRRRNSSKSSREDDTESENQIEAPAFRRNSIPVRRRPDDALASRYSAEDLDKEKGERSVAVFRKHFVVDSSSTYLSNSNYTSHSDAPVSGPTGVYVHEFEIDNGILALVEIGDPFKANSLSSQSFRSIEQAFRGLAKRDELRCVILTGCKTPGVPIFSAGANIKEMEAITTPEQAQAFISTVFAACEAVRKCPVPTIARIEGSCFGAALEIAACCDFRYGIQNSTFSMKEVALGIPSVIQARMLANIIGWQETKKLVFRGVDYSAKRMLAVGLLDGCYETSQLLDHTLDKLVKVIANNGPKAMRAQKALNRFWEENSLKSGIVEGIETFSRMWEDGGSEPKQYMRAWLQRSRHSELKEHTEDNGDDEVEDNTEDEATPAGALKWNFLKLKRFTEGDRGLPVEARGRQGEISNEI